jgi:hypothetical protein
MVAQIGDDVAPQVGRGRVSVQENDRVPVADIDLTHLRVEHGDTPSGMRIGWIELSIRHRCIGHR